MSEKKSLFSFVISNDAMKKFPAFVFSLIEREIRYSFFQKQFLVSKLRIVEKS